MANIPKLPITIVGKIKNGTITYNSTYSNPTSIYDGYPYTFNVTLELVAPTNSDDTLTPNQYTYDANNIEVGMWFGQPNGLMYKIISKSTPTSDSEIDVVLKDVDLFNLLSDPNFTGSNIPYENTYGIVFNISEDGDPVINGLSLQSGNLSPDPFWINDFYARFQYRNLISSYYNNDDTSLLYATGYTVGQLVYLDSTGQFQVVDDTNQAQLEKAFGVITSVNEPEDGNMTVRPFGKITGGLNLSTVGSIGDVLYYDMTGTTTNYATDVKPTNNPLPVYIKISDTTGSSIGWPLVTGTGGSGTGGVAGTSGSSGESGTSGSSGFSFNWLGIWDGTVGGGSNISYGLNDVVYYNGTTYIFTNTTPSGVGSGEPGTNPDWDVMAVSGANGTSGSAGESGTSGSSGESGTSGSSGETGTSGSSGESGTSGSSGETGTSGSSGESGTSGSSGEAGTSGSSGENGTSGSSGLSGASVTGATLTNTILELQNSDSTTIQVEFDPSNASQSKEGVTTHGFLFLDETAFTGDTFNNVFTTSSITDNIQVYYLDNSQLTAKLTYVVLDIGGYTTTAENKVLVLPQLTGSFESKVIKFIMKRNELDPVNDVMIGSKWISSGNSDRIIAANINTKLANSGYFFPLEPLESVEILYDGYDWLVVNTQKQQYVQATPVNYLLYGTNGTVGSFKNRTISNLL
jgi:hypothetical protein